MTALAAACSGEDLTQVGSAPALRPGERGPLGSVALAISSGGVALSSVRFRLEDASGRIVMSDVLEVATPSEAVTLEFDAPVGTDYRLTLDAEGGAGVSCSGSSSFSVAAGSVTELSLELVCEDSGGVRVVGTVSAPSSCPQVELGPPAAPVYVGDALQLEASVPEGEEVEYAWASSGGTLTDSRSRAAVLTCTEEGPLTLTLSVTRGECSEVDSVEIECLPRATASACGALGSTCHVVDPGSGPLHDCHELGHAGDEAACSEGRSTCVQACGAALCETLGSLCHDVDPGSGALHECHELGHAGDASACFERGRECFDLCTQARDGLRQPVTIEFAAKVGGQDFACGTTYENVGASGVSAQPRDFRFFVSDVRLLTASGAAEPVVIDAFAPWQLPGVALLDFASDEGACSEGSAATHTSLRGRVMPGQYTGIAFRVGVPEDLNHDDPATLPAPLDLGVMSWGWLLGYKFLVAEMEQVGADAGSPGAGVLHLGSTACTGNPAAGTVQCSKPNRSDVRLTGYDPTSSTIVADIGALFAGVDLTQNALCHSSGDSCAASFASAGIDFSTGLPRSTQSLFRVE